MFQDKYSPVFEYTYPLTPLYMRRTCTIATISGLVLVFWFTLVLLSLCRGLFYGERSMVKNLICVYALPQIKRFTHDGPLEFLLLSRCTCERNYTVTRQKEIS